MSNIRLLGRKTSVNVQKVIWALEELGLTYEREDRGGPFGRTRDDPDYMAMNPMALVPTLCDGEVVVWESHAAVRYLAAKYGAGTLWPERPEDRAVVDQWADWTASHFQPGWLGVFSRIVLTPPSKRDAAGLAAQIALANDLFGILDARLGTVPYLAGDRLTYADILAGASLYRWTTLEIERPSMPGVEAWHERLKSHHPAFVEATYVSYEAMRVKD